LGGVGINGGANGDGSTRGGDGTLGNAVTFLGNDDEGWMYCRMTGIGPM